MQTRTMLNLSEAVAQLERATGMVKTDTNDAIANSDHLELVRHYSKLREVTETIKKARLALDNLEDHLSHIDIPDAFRRVGVRTVIIDDVGRVTVAHKWGCSITDGSKQEAFHWLRERGNGGIIIETIPWQTLAAFARTEVEERGKELPTELFTTTITPYTSITKV